MVVIKCIVVFLTLVVYTHQTNYCDRSLCGNRHHIACHNSGKFARTCKDPRTVFMSPKLKDLIVSNHNHFRNMIASGSEHRYQSAAKMPTLKWNDELASMAHLNVLQCRMAHDKCRNTMQFRYSGQNLAIQSSTGQINIESAVKGMITRWYKEHSKASMKDINKYRRSSRKIGHFTAMVQDKASDIGCAIATYRSGRWNNLLLACNYSYTNVIGTPVYTTGRSCSMCRTGCNSRYPALCNEHENVDPKP